MYCAIHNADCNANADDSVLCVAPHKIPSVWICAEAVVEISGFEHQADDILEMQRH